MVSLHNNNPSLDTERLYRVMKGGRNSTCLPDENAVDDSTDDVRHIFQHGGVAFRQTTNGRAVVRVGIIQKMVRRARSAVVVAGQQAKMHTTMYRRPVDLDLPCPGLCLTCTLFDVSSEAGTVGRRRVTIVQFADAAPVSVEYDAVIQRVRLTPRPGGAGFIVNAADVPALGPRRGRV
jgi:hypothetical protein